MNRIIIKSPIIITLLFLLTGLNGYTQKQPYNAEVTVVAGYQPSLSDANKINFSPEIKDSLQEKPKFAYSIKSAQIPLGYSPEPIEAAKMSGEPISKLYNNLLKAGFGSYITPYAEYFYNGTRSKDYAYGLHFKHLSSTGKIDDYAFPGYSENSIEAYGKKFVDKKFILSGDVGFHRDVVHFYGFNPKDFTPEPSKNDYKQRFSLINASLGIKSTQPDSSKIGYDADFSIYHLADKYSTGELGISLLGELHQERKLADISPTQLIKLGGGIELFNNKAKNYSSSTTGIITIQPSISGKIDALDLRLGLNLSIEADSLSEFHLYPDVEVGIQVVPKWLRLFAGATGSLERNSFRKYIEVNPFVTSDIPPSFRNKKYKMYIGLNSTLFDAVDLYVNFSRSQIKNMPFFVNDTTQKYGNKFTVIYDPDATLMDINTELSFRQSESLRVLARFNYHQYTTSNTKKHPFPWQSPDYEFSLSVAYNMQNKILAEAEFIYFDKMYALTYNKGKIETNEIRNRPDFNIGIEYRYTKLLGIFLKMNNLASIRYYSWNNYPLQKFNVMGGLSFSF